jgi:DNA polymerase III subunit delta
MARAARLAGVQVIVGEDTYLADEALERVLSGAIGEDRRESLRVFHGDEEKWADVLAAARTGSLFATRRAVVVRRAEMFAEDRRKEEDEPAGGERKARKAKASPADHPVVAYADDPPPEVTLVLVARKPDRRLRPWKALLPKATVHDALPKKGRALRAHVEAELRARGLRLAPDALDGLLGEVGQDLRRLMGEVDKLEAWTGGSREVTVEDVGAVLGRGMGQPLYRLSDAFAGRDVAASLEMVERLLADGEEPLRILATLHRSLRQVRGAVSLRSAGVAPAEIGARLLPANMQFKLGDLLDASRRWREDTLRAALVAVDRADRGIKRGADAGTALVAAVAESCGGGARPTSRRGGR